MIKALNDGSNEALNEPLLGAFLDYVAGYDAADPKIRLKIDHSLQVADLCREIAEDLSGEEATSGVCPANPGLAWKIGLLHDIGRFEQIRRYGTFVDALSVDHAALGADLLFKEGLLDRLEQATDGRQAYISERGRDWEHRLMERSIRYHNRYRLPQGLTAEEKLYCDLIRDADKIDIFRVLCDTPVEQIYNVSSEELRSCPVTDQVKACFWERTAVLRSLKKTPVDNIVGHICLYFELVYPISRRIAREQGYLDRLLSFRSDNEETARWFQTMGENIF